MILPLRCPSYKLYTNSLCPCLIRARISITFIFSFSLEHYLWKFRKSGSWIWFALKHSKINSNVFCNMFRLQYFRSLGTSSNWLSLLLSRQIKYTLAYLFRVYSYNYIVSWIEILYTSVYNFPSMAANCCYYVTLRSKQSLGFLLDTCCSFSKNCKVV